MWSSLPTIGMWKLLQPLTMLKLDAETRDIPVLTYTTEYEGQDFDSAIARLADEDDEDLLPAARPALRMH